MTKTSRQIFENHFQPSALKEVIDTYLSPSSARGVDGTNYDHFVDRANDETNLISSRALTGPYSFSPFRQKLIVKDAESPPRQVSIPTIRDKIALRALNNFLSEIFYEARPQHSHPVISTAIKSIDEAASDDSFIKLDIKSFYDGIQHESLLKNLRRKIRSTEPIKMIASAITTPTGSNISESKVNTVGVPQGLSISNILASIYLQSIDEKYQFMPGLAYHRYVDDILCIAPSSKAHSISTAISKDLKSKKKLNTHSVGSGKSMIVPISDGVEYLGYSFKGGCVSVRKATEKKLLPSLMRIIHSATKKDLPRSIWRINLRISGCRFNGSNIGWVFYFSQINDIQLLARMDAQIKRAIRRRFGSAEYGSCKRLVKAYHEAKYNHQSGRYFYNFDTIDRANMIALLERLFPGRLSSLEEKSESEIRKIFNRAISREVREMERDTLGDFS